MSVIDNALQALLGLAVEVKTLWPNASPGSSFAEQNLTVNTAGCDFILIPLKGDASIAGGTVGGSILIGKVGEAGQHVGQNAARIESRSITWTSTTQIAVGNCQSVGDYNNAATRVNTNSHMIPLCVYGLKLSGGGNELVDIFANLLSYLERRCA